MKTALNELSKELNSAIQLAVIKDLSVGEKIPTKDGRWIKIMAYSDNYYMARFKGCMPFVCKEQELRDKIDKNGYGML